MNPDEWFKQFGPAPSPQDPTPLALPPPAPVQLQTKTLTITNKTHYPWDGYIRYTVDGDKRQYHIGCLRGQATGTYELGKVDKRHKFVIESVDLQSKVHSSLTLQLATTKPCATSRLYIGWQDVHKAQPMPGFVG